MGAVLASLALACRPADTSAHLPRTPLDSANAAGMHAGGALTGPRLSPAERATAARHLANGLAEVQARYIASPPAQREAAVWRVVAHQDSAAVRYVRIAAASYLLGVDLLPGGVQPEERASVVRCLETLDEAGAVDLVLMPQALAAVHADLAPARAAFLARRLVARADTLPRLAGPRQQRYEDSLIALVRPLVR